MLGQLARERWSRANREADIAATPAGTTDAWPASLEPDLETYIPQQTEQDSGQFLITQGATES
jgi:hypothetical protein